MDRPNPLLTALAAHAAAAPESPFLFWPHGWDWRWWSWQRVARLAARWQAALSGLPAGTRVAFAGDAFPHAFVLDLAAQAAGLTPEPLPAGAAAAAAAGPPPPGAAAWLEVEAAVVRRDWSEGAEGEVRVRLAEGASGAGARAAGPAVWAQGPAGWRRLGLAALTAAAERVDALVEEPPDGAAGVESPVRRSAEGSGARRGAAPAGGWGWGRTGAAGEREIVLGGPTLGTDAGRVVAAWAILSGAALLLDASPEQRRGSLVWARPTVGRGGEEELAWLLEVVAAAPPPRGWRPWGRAAAGARPPFGRLRTLLQSTAPDAAAVAFWRQRGVRLAQLPRPSGVV